MQVIPRSRFASHWASNCFYRLELILWIGIVSDHSAVRGVTERRFRFRPAVEDTRREKTTRVEESYQRPSAAAAAVATGRGRRWGSGGECD